MGGCATRCGRASSHSSGGSFASWHVFPGTTSSSGATWKPSGRHSQRSSTAGLTSAEPVVEPEEVALAASRQLAERITERTGHAHN